MGTWSVDPFGNDDAADWAYELEEAEDIEPIQAAIEAVLEAGDEYLEAPDAAIAIAAIDVLGRLMGRAGESSTYTEAIDTWVEKVDIVPEEEVLYQALQALDRIVAENSELRELWEESDDFEAWNASMQSLRSRIAS